MACIVNIIDLDVYIVVPITLILLSFGYTSALSYGLVNTDRRGREMGGVKMLNSY